MSTSTSSAKAACSPYPSYTRNGGRVPAASEWCDVIYESQFFPVTAWGVTNRLSPELTEKIKEAFLSFDFVNSKLYESWPEDEK